MGIVRTNEVAEPSRASLNGMVYEALLGGGWWTPWELCRFIGIRARVKVSDSSITARLRDLRKPRYGANVIEKRQRGGSKAFEYRMAK